MRVVMISHAGRLASHCTIDEFADHHGLVMEVTERNSAKLPRFYANFRNAEEQRGNMLIGTHGNGETPAEAINDYARKISGKRLRINPAWKSERSVEVPRLV